MYRMGGASSGECSQTGIGPSTCAGERGHDRRREPRSLPKRLLGSSLPLSLVLVLAFCVVPTTGCTVIGLTAGAIRDATRDDRVTASGGAVLRDGRRLRVTAPDGSVQRMRYRGRLTSREAYQSMTAAHPDLPAWGQEVTLDMRPPTDPIEGRLIGFRSDMNDVRLVLATGDSGGRVRDARLDNVQRIEHPDGRVVSPDRLRAMVTGAAIPPNDGMLVGSRAHLAVIPVNGGHTVEVAPHRGLLRGLLIGLALDVTALLVTMALLAAAFSNFGEE